MYLKRAYFYDIFKLCNLSISFEAVNSRGETFKNLVN